MLLGIKDLTWLSMKKFLGQRGVKEDIINFNSMNLPPEVTIKVEALVRKKSQSFDATAIKKVSIAAAPLAAWVKANLQYARVLKDVTPLQADLDEAENELQMRQEEVDNCDSEILSINTNVENLREKFSDQVRNAEVLKENLRMTNERLETAEHLLVGLNNESVRWQDSVIQLENELDHACVQSLLFSGFITYLSDKDGPTRNASIQDWIRMMENVPESSAFDFDLSLVGATEVQRISWRTWGLPTESLYLENAIIISNAGGKVSMCMHLAC